MEAQKRPNTKVEAQNLFKQRWYQIGITFFQKRGSQNGMFPIFVILDQMFKGVELAVQRHLLVYT